MTMIARARGMVALVSQTLSEWIVLFSSSSAFYHLRIHLAPSRLSRRQGKKWRSRNQNRSWKLKMLILSQMPIPQTVLSILSYLSISIAIYWKLTNSLNTLHSSQFNRVHLAKNRLRRFQFNNHFIMMNFWGMFRSTIGDFVLLATEKKQNDFDVGNISWRYL